MPFEGGVGNHLFLDVQERGNLTTAWPGVRCHALITIVSKRMADHAS
jgi:hypothetical protein